MFLDRRELETKMSLLRPEASRFSPVLSLNVVNDGRLRPCQQSWYNEADTFTGTCRSKREHVLRAIMPQVMESAIRCIRPTPNVDTLTRIEQPRSPNVFFSRPSRGPMDILAVPRQPLNPAHV